MRTNGILRHIARIQRFRDTIGQRTTTSTYRDPSGGLPPPFGQTSFGKGDTTQGKIHESDPLEMQPVEESERKCNADTTDPGYIPKKAFTRNASVLLLELVNAQRGDLPTACEIPTE